MVDNDISVFTGFAIILLVLGMYVAPTAIGWHRRISSGLGLMIANLFFGWTLVGWVVCLIWAVTAKRNPPAPVATCSDWRKKAAA